MGDHQGCAEGNHHSGESLTVLECTDLCVRMKGPRMRVEKALCSKGKKAIGRRDPKQRQPVAMFSSASQRAAAIDSFLMTPRKVTVGLL